MINRIMQRVYVHIHNEYNAMDNEDNPFIILEIMFSCGL